MPQYYREELEGMDWGQLVQIHIDLGLKIRNRHDEEEDAADVLAEDAAVTGPQGTTIAGTPRYRITKDFMASLGSIMR